MPRFIFNRTYFESIPAPSEEEVRDYYIRANSRMDILEKIVTHDCHVPNHPLRALFDQKLQAVLDRRYSLLKVLSNGGSGKSTFLFDVARQYCTRHVVLYLDGKDGDPLKDILNGLEHIKDIIEPTKAILLFLDNAANFEALPTIRRQFAKRLPSHRLLLILSEREDRYDNLPDKASIEREFDRKQELTFNSGPNRQYIKRRFFQQLLLDQKILPSSPSSERIKKIVEHTFTQRKKLSIAECVHQVLLSLRKQKLIMHQFDWEDWNAFAAPKQGNWKYLYSLLALFYQFGIQLRLSFCMDLLDLTRIEAFDLLSQKRTAPVSLKRLYNYDHILLRHESIATWYFDPDSTLDNAHESHQRIALELLKKLLSKLDTPFRRGLFLWLLKQPELEKSFVYNHPDGLKAYVRDQATPSWSYHEYINALLLHFLKIELKHATKDDLKALTEIGRSYARIKEYKKAKKYFKKAIKLDSDNVHTRTELGKVFQAQGEWSKAENILLQAIDKDPNDVHPRTELGKVLKKLRRSQEAQVHLEKVVELDVKNVHARTELGQLYRKKKAWSLAEHVLKEAIRLDPSDYHPKNELALVYKSDKRQREAIVLFSDIIKIRPRDRSAYSDLGEIFKQARRYSIALSLFETAQNNHPNNEFVLFHLAEVYLKMGYVAKGTPLKEKIKVLLFSNPRHKHARGMQNIIDIPQNEWILEKDRQIGEYTAEGILYKKRQLIPIVPNPTISYSCKRGDKVFFSIYKKPGENHRYANFIEPYYSNLDDLSKVW